MSDSKKAKTTSHLDNYIQAIELLKSFAYNFATGTLEGDNTVQADLVGKAHEIITLYDGQFLQPDIVRKKEHPQQ